MNLRHCATALISLALLTACGASKPEPPLSTTSSWYEVYNVKDGGTSTHPYREITLKDLATGEVYANIRLDGDGKPGVEIQDTLKLSRGRWKSGSYSYEDFTDLRERVMEPEEPETGSDETIITSDGVIL